MMDELDQEQIKILRNAFDAFDSDKEGVIQTDNFGTILEMLGHRLDPKTLKQMIASVDTEDSGLLDFEEFCQLASKFVDVEEDVEAIAQELREAFRMYDKEGKGYLTTDVLRDILHELDDKLSSEDLDMMIDEIDADGSGTVDFEEFMEVMTG